MRRSRDSYTNWCAGMFIFLFSMQGSHRIKKFSWYWRSTPCFSFTCFILLNISVGKFLVDVWLLGLCITKFHLCVGQNLSPLYKFNICIVSGTSTLCLIRNDLVYEVCLCRLNFCIPSFSSIIPNIRLPVCMGMQWKINIHTLSCLFVLFLFPS